MNITEQENTLFKKWMQKENRRPFIKDGSPSPESYIKQKKHILFILKDANFGLSEEEQENCNHENKDFYDQRLELRDNPNQWWQKVSNWCVPILHPALKWEEVKQKSSKELIKSLAPFAFMQLKKNAGGGSVETAKLWKTAEDNKSEIKEQIAIYQPDFIVCCGVGEIVYKEVFSGEEKLKYTPNGVGYWDVLIKNHNTHIIDFCHPSARFGKKIEGAVAFGLSAAINHLGSNES